MRGKEGTPIVLASPESPAATPDAEPERKPRAEPKPRPFPLPGATMQPPPPEPSKS